MCRQKSPLADVIVYTNSFPTKTACGTATFHCNKCIATLHFNHCSATISQHIALYCKYTEVLQCHSLWPTGSVEEEGTLGRGEPVQSPVTSFTFNGLHNISVCICICIYICVCVFIWREEAAVSCDALNCLLHDTYIPLGHSISDHTVSRRIATYIIAKN